MNSGIELHDAKVVSILPTGPDLVVRFEPAFIHVSAGQPGIDSGFVSVQPVDLVIVGNAIVSSFDLLPQELENGENIAWRRDSSEYLGSAVGL